MTAALRDAAPAAGFVVAGIAVLYVVNVAMQAIVARWHHCRYCGNQYATRRAVGKHQRKAHQS